MKTYLLILFLLLAVMSLTLAHGGKKHKKDSTAKHVDSLNRKHGEHIQGDITHHDEVLTPDGSNVAADLSDFPSIHPLIVHFAIVLILVAAVLQLVNVIILKKDIAWIIAAMLFVGFLTAWFASTTFHPHAHGISARAKLVLQQHDKFADWTIITAIIALVLQIVYLFLIRFNPSMYTVSINGVDRLGSRLNRGFAIVVAIVLLSSAYCVLHAGHYGAQLVHIEGIGPQGKYLEIEHDH
ncbi:MAG: hypothetical protein ABI663_17440 [Chryseolinea sp.]